MTLQSMIAVVFTIFVSIGFVAVIILLGWFLIWKAFLSKFRLVRELLGQEVEEQHGVEAEKPTNIKPKKVRKE